MDIHEVMQILESKFTSGNKISVERSTILRSEFEVLKDFYLVTVTTETHADTDVTDDVSDVGC